MKRIVLIAAIVFVITKLIFSSLFVFFEPSIDGIDFEIQERPAFIPTSWLFAIAMALLTLLIAIILKYGNIRSRRRSIGVVSVITLFMIIGIMLRNQQVKHYFTYVVRPFFQAKHQLPYLYPIDPKNFVYYMFVGACVGCIIAFFLFKQKNEPAK